MVISADDKKILLERLQKARETKAAKAAATKAAKAKADALPYPIPHMGALAGAKIPHFNLLRKAQCHGGWDWGISL